MLSGHFCFDVCVHLCASLLFACVWARLWVISLVVVAGFLGKGMVVLLSYFVEIGSNLSLVGLLKLQERLLLLAISMVHRLLYG